MAVLSSAVSKIGWRESGTAGAFTEVAAGLDGVPEIEINDDTLPTAVGIDRRAGIRKTFTVPVYDWSAFAALDTLQQARKSIELQITLLAGTVLTYDPVRFTVVPVFNQVPSLRSVFVGATTAAGDPGSDPLDWTELGSILEGSSIELNAVANADGENLPLYSKMTLRHEMELINNHATNDVATVLATYENALCKAALLHSNGDYSIYSNVYSSVRHNPSFEVEDFITQQWVLEGVGSTLANLITFPTTPPDFIWGFRIDGAAFGFAESDILTIT